VGVALAAIAYDGDLPVQDTGQISIAVVVHAHIFSPRLVNHGRPRNGRATKAGRLSVFLPFRQGEADRTPKYEDLRVPFYAVSRRCAMRRRTPDPSQSQILGRRS
jgi:hypothetical protein